MPKILLVDDERAIRSVLKEILRNEQIDTEEAADGFEALNLIKSNHYDAVLSDIKMPKIDGIEFLEKALIEKPNLPIIIFSGHGDVKVALDAVKKGAFDYLEKPPDMNKLLVSIRNAVEKSTLIKQVEPPKINAPVLNEIIGQSPALGVIKEVIKKVAPTDARVLITGENGTGKELVARALHANSRRANMPLVEVNCAAIPSELIESELFGHEKGSFTSAVKLRIGKFESAHGGTLFLDEIGDMSLAAQAKMLRALQEGRITRIGGEKDIAVDVRIIAATNKNLLEEVALKNFRLDLYHRLSVVVVKVPRLNDRVSDIPLLVEKFLNTICKAYQMPMPEIEQAAMEALQAHKWSGNIRELQNIVERLVILCGSTITAKDVKQYVLGAM